MANTSEDPKFEYFKKKILDFLDEQLDELDKKEKETLKKKKRCSAQNKAFKATPQEFSLRILDSSRDTTLQVKSQTKTFEERYGHKPNVLVASGQTLEKLNGKAGETIKFGKTILTLSSNDEFLPNTYELMNVESEILKQTNFIYPVIDMKKTGETIKRLMEENNLSVKDLQKLLRLGSVQSIYYWLNGEKLPSIDNLCILSNIFDTPIDDLISVSLIEDLEQGEDQE